LTTAILQAPAVTTPTGVGTTTPSKSVQYELTTDWVAELITSKRLSVSVPFTQKNPAFSISYSTSSHSTTVYHTRTTPAKSYSVTVGGLTDTSNTAIALTFVTPQSLEAHTTSGSIFVQVIVTTSDPSGLTSIGTIAPVEVVPLLVALFFSIAVRTVSRFTISSIFIGMIVESVIPLGAELWIGIII